MDWWDIALLMGAGLVAGAINAVAGGGSFISFPALVAAGYPARQANMTNALALVPGMTVTSLGMRTELAGQRRRLTALLLPSVPGAIIGTVTLLSTPDAAFDAIVPFLILIGCTLTWFQDRLVGLAAARNLASRDDGDVPPALHISAFLLAAYGAYFGAGFGIIVLPLLVAFLGEDLLRANAMRVVLSLFGNSIAVVTFAIFGSIAWTAAGVLALALASGGYFGAGIARRLGRRWLRYAVMGYGTASAIVLLAT